MQRNTKLLLILAGLILLSILIAFIGKEEKRSSFDTQLFTITDTTSIQSVSIEGVSSKKIIRDQFGWKLNNQYKADPNLVVVLQSIMGQVKVKRPVSNLNRKEIIASLRNEGSKVSIELNDGETLDFIAGGDGAKKKSYFLKDENAYVVEIPGYRNYISGIFELSANQWRDRLLFSSTWRSLMSLDIEYLESEGELSIYFDNKFLAVKGVEAIDTTAITGYIDQFQYFQINDYLDKGKFPKYDSLLNTKPLATISLNDIDKSKNKILTVYNLIDGEGFYLLTDESGQMMVIDSKRMQSLLASKNQFIAS